ncbi:MAG TPA: HlyD family efflux transporter periplasmic adaptor subunit [Bryobacteraceae bacterium]|nr:HlyD family efflux transporter periplasmic adaptor subunit [Bryobacteraceae bacterium]
MKAKSGRARLWAVLATAVVTLVATGAGAYRWSRMQLGETFPSAPVRKGEFLVIVRCRGELKARRAVQVNAPVNVPELRIVWLAPSGGPVREGDVIIRFDPSSAKQQLQEKKAAFQQAQATLDQAVAQARITAEQDKLDLANSRYEVERARLEASKQEIVSAIQGELSLIDLKLAQKNLRMEEATVALHAASDAAKIASLTRLRDQAKTEVEITEGRLARMELKTPISGIINFLPNYSQGWVNAKPFKVGDQAWPGGSLAEVPDLTTLEMEGKIDEIDRGRIGVGNEARVHIDSLPEITFAAKLSSISLLTEQSFEWPPTSSFRAFGHIQKPDPRLRPGMNGGMDVVVNRLPDAISIPAKALFTRHGKPTVYVAQKAGYRPVEVQVAARNPDEVAIRGIGPGSVVSLVDLEKQTQ